MANEYLTKTIIKRVSQLPADLKQQNKALDQKTNTVEKTDLNADKALVGSEDVWSRVDRASRNLSWLIYLAYSLLLVIGAYRIIRGVFVTESKHATRAQQIFMGVTGVALGILGVLAVSSVLYISTAILMVVGAARGVLGGLWDVGIAVYDRFFGEGKKAQAEIKKITDSADIDINRLTELTNAQRARNQVVADKIHLVVQSVVALIGAALLFTPLAPIGGCILVGIAAYGLADGFKLNPFKWMASKIYNPFKAKTSEEIATKFTRTKKIEPTETPVLEKQIAPVPTTHHIIRRIKKIKKTIKRFKGVGKRKSTSTKIHHTQDLHQSLFHPAEKKPKLKVTRKRINRKKPVSLP
jgi:hypothetical protein